MGVTGINKIITSGDKVSAERLIGFAKSQMEILINQMSFQKLKQGIRRVQPYAGVLVECSKVFDQQTCKIWVEPIIKNVFESEDTSDIVICFNTIDSFILKKYKLDADTYFLMNSLTIDRASVPWVSKNTDIPFIGWGKRVFEEIAINCFILVIWKDRVVYALSESGLSDNVIMNSSFSALITDPNISQGLSANSPTFPGGFYSIASKTGGYQFFSIDTISLLIDDLPQNNEYPPGYYDINNLTNVQIPRINDYDGLVYQNVSVGAVAGRVIELSGYISGINIPLLDSSSCFSGGSSTYIFQGWVPGYPFQSLPYSDFYMNPTVTKSVSKIVLRSKESPNNVIATYTPPSTIASVSNYFCTSGGPAYWLNTVPDPDRIDISGERCTYLLEYEKSQTHGCSIIAVVPNKYIVVYLSSVKCNSDSGWQYDALKANYSRSVSVGVDLPARIVVLSAQDLSVLYYLPAEQEASTVVGGGPYK